MDCRHLMNLSTSYSVHLSSLLIQLYHRESPIESKSKEVAFDESEMEALYRKIFEDLLIEADESQEIVAFYKNTPPPKDKLRWTRASAFRIGSEFVTDDKTKNIALLRCINSVVHSFELNCLR